ncbi:MAG: sugar ABC transporter permease YjfF [Treponema sp.]|nr:sugar ABC transporter permease YjfF [Treponema sp.]MCL2271768.1 sugar ABC transporter permease YjfF [Treponema sp.]
MQNNSSSSKISQLTDSNLLLMIAISIFIILYVSAMFFFGGSFARFQGLFDLFNNNASLLILACALSIVMVGGGIDISVGGVVALITAACAVYLDSGSGNIFVSVCIALGIGLTFGLVQGFLVAYMNVQPFIITLAGMFFARGMATVITANSHTVKLESFVQLRSIRLEINSLGYVARNGNLIPATIDIGVFIALFLVVIIAVVLKWTRFGRNLYAVGGNSQSALMLGINVRRTRFYSYVVCGLLAGVAGYVFLLKAGSGYSQHAMIFEMRAIAASIIGGTMLTGGVGNIVGSPIGVLVLMTIETIVRGSGITAGGRIWLQDVTTGVILFLALVLQSMILSYRGNGSFKNKKITKKADVPE